MSQQTPPPQSARSSRSAGQEIPEGALPGQITHPNPVEVFWEQHKREIIIGFVAILLALGGTKFWEYMQRQKRNALWTQFSSAVGFDANYALEGVSAFEMFPAQGLYKPYKQFGGAFATMSIDELEAATKAVSGGHAEVLANWLLAARLARDGQPDKAKSAIERVRSLAPQFAGLVKLNYPPIYVPLPDKEDDDDANKKRSKRKDDVKPPKPQPAELDQLMLAAAKHQKAFAEQHEALYTAPEPSAKPVITFATSAGSFKVRLYTDRAKKHCAQFLKNCKAGLYNGMRFHEIRREPTDANRKSTYEGDIALLGDPESKQEDRSKWGTFRSTEQLGPEDSGVSHFRYMLAAFRDSSKIGSDKQLIYFTGSDCADKRDGSYVVFGRVVEGKEVIDKIVGAKMSSTAEETGGIGKPAEAIVVEKVTIES